MLALSKNNTKVNFVLIRTIYKVGDYYVSPDCLNSSCNKKYLNAMKGDNLWIDILQERDADREKIKIMTEENAQLQFEKKSNMNESTNLEQELESARLKIAGNSSFTDIVN